MDLTPEMAAKAAHHASEAERLLAAAGQSIFRFVSPMANTPERALALASVHAALANYYATTRS